MQVCFPAWLVVLRMNIVNLVHVMTVTLLYALETFPLQIPAAGISTTAHIWTSGKSDTFMVNQADEMNEVCSFTVQNVIKV